MSTEPIKPGHHLVRYQFGKPDGPDPSAAGKRSQEVNGPRVGVRAALRRLTTVEFDDDGRIPSKEELAKAFGGRKLTLGEGVALRMMASALAGDTKTANKIIDQVDGKVPNVNVNTDMPLADLIAAARKELRDESAGNRAD